MSNKAENTQLNKALDFLRNVGDKPYGDKNVSQYDRACAVLIDVYKDAIKNAIKPKHMVSLRTICLIVMLWKHK